MLYSAMLPLPVDVRPKRPSLMLYPCCLGCWGTLPLHRGAVRGPHQRACKQARAGLEQPVGGV